jgi:hypothetical protein
MAEPEQPSWGYVEAPRMLASTIDWHPRVNGYSGFTPANYSETVTLLNSLSSGRPDPAALALLRRIGVRYVVIRTSPLTAPVLGSVPAAIGLDHLDEDGAQRVLAALGADEVVRVSSAGKAVLLELRQ